MKEKYLKPDCEFIEYQQVGDILTLSTDPNLNNDDNYSYNP